MCRIMCRKDGGRWSVWVFCGHRWWWWFVKSQDPITAGEDRWIWRAWRWVLKSQEDTVKIIFNIMKEHVQVAMKEHNLRSECTGTSADICNIKWIHVYMMMSGKGFWDTPSEGPMNNSARLQNRFRWSQIESVTALDATAVGKANVASLRCRQLYLHLISSLAFWMTPCDTIHERWCIYSVEILKYWGI